MNALAYRVWAYAEPLGWDCTVSEIADAIGASPTAVGRVVSLKGWQTRVRTSGLNAPGGFHNGPIGFIDPGPTHHTVRAELARFSRIVGI